MEISETVIVIPLTFASETISTIGSSYTECVVDMNGDFKDDIVTVNSANLHLNLQGDAGAFTVADYTIANPGFAPSWSIAAGDYNRDGYNDLLLGSGSGLTFGNLKQEAVTLL
ncbi:MAG: VCBS repeat-containing protein [Flavobacteriaceae bacterium]